MTTGQENFSQFDSSNLLPTSYLVGYDSAANVEKKFPVASITSYIQGNLPVASSTQLGAIIPGSGVTMNGSTLSANVLSVNGATGAVVIQAGDTSTQSGFSLISASGASSGTIGIRRIVGANNVVIQNDSFNNLQVGITPTPSFSRVLINTIADDGSSVIQAGGQISTVNASNVVKAFGTSQGFTVQTAAGTQLSPTAVASGTQLGIVQMSGHNGSTFTPVASIAAYSEGAYSTTSTPSDLRFYTTATSSTTQTERMRLFPSGNLAIASTTDNGSQLQVTGNATISSTLTAANLTATGAVSAATLSTTGTASFGGLATGVAPAAADNSNTFSTTAWVKSLIASGTVASLGSAGYQKLPSGLIIQWGPITAVPTTGTTVNFPIPYPTGCVFLTASVATNGSTPITVAGQAISKSQFTLYASSGTPAVNMFSMGY